MGEYEDLTNAYQDHIPSQGLDDLGNLTCKCGDFFPYNHDGLFAWSRHMADVAVGHI